MVSKWSNFLKSISKMQEKWKSKHHGWQKIKNNNKNNKNLRKLSGHEPPPLRVKWHELHHVHYVVVVSCDVWQDVAKMLRLQQK